jgi:hypothetical protein
MIDKTEKKHNEIFSFTIFICNAHRFHRINISSDQILTKRICGQNGKFYFAVEAAQNKVNLNRVGCTPACRNAPPRAAA